MSRVQEHYADLFTHIRLVEQYVSIEDALFERDRLKREIFQKLNSVPELFTEARLVPTFESIKSCLSVPLFYKYKVSNPVYRQCMGEGTYALSKILMKWVLLVWLIG